MTRTSAFRPIINVVLVSALVILALAVNVALAEQPDKKGQPGATEPKDTGVPTDPNGFGTVTSQVGTTTHTVGEHASGFAPGQDPDAEPAQRLGVGNVSRTDSCHENPDPACFSLEDTINTFDLDPSGDVVDTGGHPGDHANLIDGIDTNPLTDVSKDPGLPEECRGPGGDCPPS